MLTHVACPSWGTYTLIALTTVTTNSTILTRLTCTISVYEGEQHEINNSPWLLIYNKISQKMPLQFLPWIRGALWAKRSKHGLLCKLLGVGRIFFSLPCPVVSEKCRVCLAWLMKHQLWRLHNFATFYYKEQCKEEGANKRSVGRIISLSGQGWGFATLQEKLKIKSNGGKGLLCLWRPNGHHDYTIGAGTYLFHKWAQPSQADKCIGSY